MSRKVMLYEDFTSSGRGLKFIEDYLQATLVSYANTHTETSWTGNLVVSKHLTCNQGLVTSEQVNAAYQMLVDSLHVPKDFFIIPIGAGVTGAIEKLQQILGLFMAPRTAAALDRVGFNWRGAFAKDWVVFVSPYVFSDVLSTTINFVKEHHSNDLSWQLNTGCEFVRIKANSEFARFFES